MKDHVRGPSFSSGDECTPPRDVRPAPEGTALSPVRHGDGQPPPTATLGRVGSYELIEVIGQGAMGKVFRAYEPALNRVVALKLLAAGAPGGPATASQFLDGAQAQARVRHDNVCPVFHAAQVDEHTFLTMPVLDGESLDATLRRERVPLAEAVRIGREVAEGLEAAHLAGVIHADIKPANVWLEGADRRVKILDFSLSRTITAGVRYGVPEGTPTYRSPEQEHGAAVDFRTDLYSLGMVLSELLGGVPASRAPTMSAADAAPATNPPGLHPTPDPLLPAALRALLGRLLATDPADRPPDAGEVVAGLESVEASVRATSEPSPFDLDHLPADPTRVGIRAGWRATAAVALAAVTVTGGLVATVLAVVRFESRPLTSQPELRATRSTEARLPLPPPLPRYSPEQQRAVDWARGQKNVAVVYRLSGSLSEHRAATAGEPLPAEPYVLSDLDFTNSRVLDEQNVVHLRAIPPVTGRLTLKRSNITNESFAALSTYPGLCGVEELVLTETGLDEDGLAHIGRFGRLKMLQAEGMPVTARHLYPSAGYRELQSVKFNDCRLLGDEGAALLLEYPNLKSVRLLDSGVTPAGLRTLSRHAGVTHLQYGRLTEVGLDALTRFPNLGHLDLTGELPPGGLARLFRLPILHKLRLVNTGVRDADLAALAMNLKVSDLTIENEPQRVTDGCVDFVRRSRQIKSVTFKNTAVTASALQQLVEDRPDLVSVTLGNVRIDRPSP